MDADTIIAGLLHDTVEDTDGEMHKRCEPLLFGVMCEHCDPY